MNPILIANLAVLGARFQTRVIEAQYRVGFRVAERVAPARYRSRVKAAGNRVNQMSGVVKKKTDQFAKATGVGTIPSVLTLGLGNLGKAQKLGKLSGAAVKAAKAGDVVKKVGSVRKAGQALAARPQPVSGMAETTPVLPSSAQGRRPARVNPTVIEGEPLPAAEIGRGSPMVGGGFHQATPARVIAQNAADRGQTSDPHIDQRFLEQIRADFPEQTVTTETLNQVPEPSPQPQPAARRTLPPRVTHERPRTRQSRTLTGV